MPRCVVVIPAGPAEDERSRVLDGLEALRAHEPGLRDVVVVDDVPRGGGLRAWPAGVRAIANPRAGRGIGTLGGTCAGTLAGLAVAHALDPGAWILRLDADALVVGPFAAAVEEALRPGDGILGSCHRSCNGATRDLRALARDVRRHTRPVWAWRHPPRRPCYVRPADRVVRGLLREAAAQGYRAGEHCMAAGCAIAPALVAAAAQRGWLAQPRRWIGARLGDDVLLGAMARACGLGLRDLPSVFGLAHVGLADRPQALLDRGFGVVHSLKNDPGHPEPELRAFFAAARR